MQHLRPSDYRVMPWKDGGGSTTEIAIEPAGSSLTEPFLWRVSSALVEVSGPFSRFPGYERSLLLLEGAGLILDVADKGRQRLKHPGQVVTFSGDDTVNAALIQGASVDFGVISDPRRVKVALEWHNLGPLATALTLAPTTLIFAPWGPVRVGSLGIELDHQEGLLFGGQASEAITKLSLRAVVGTTPVVVVSIWPV